MNLPRSRFLIVENGEEDGLILSQLLERSGVATTTICRSAEAGLEMLEAAAGSEGDPPAAAFVDVRLPGRTGFEFLAAVRASTAHHNMIVVLLSASDEPRNLGKAMQLGANCFLIKFPTVSAMRDVVAAIHKNSTTREAPVVLPIVGNLLLATSAGKLSC